MSTQPTAHPVLGLTDEAKQRMHSKLQILHLLDHYRLAHDYSHQVAQVMFARGWNSGELAMDDALRIEWPQLSAKTLDKWRLKLKNNGVASLAGQYGKRKGQTGIDEQPDLRDHILGVLVDFPHIRATRVLEFLQARFRDVEDIDLPSERTLRRWIADWKVKNAQTFTAVTNPDAWKNKFMSAMGSASEAFDRLNQRWELDCTPADLHLIDGRYVLSGGIDVYSRRPMLLVTKSARSAANAQLLRKMMLAYGMPEEVKTDQGKDYISREMTTTLAALNVRQCISNKFSPWEKPHIERFFRSFSHDLLELMPGYSGHNVADAQALRASQSFATRLFQKDSVITLKMTAEELQTFCDNWIESRYLHRAHSGLNGQTPFALAADWREPIRRIDDERALDLLLAEVPQNNGLRVVQKKGLRLPEGWYEAPELEAYIGQQVIVRYLPDAGRAVVYNPDGWRFVCIAQLPELCGISREEIAAKTKHLQRERVQQERSVLREISKRIRATDAAAEILRDNMLTSGKLVPFPQRSESHTTPALQAAAQAHDALNQAPRDSSELIDHDTFTQMRLAQEAKELTPQPRFESRSQRAFWIANQSYQRTLAHEEQDYLDSFRRDKPQQAIEMDKLMQLRHGDDDAAEM